MSSLRQIVDPDTGDTIDLDTLKVAVSKYSGPDGNCIGASALPGGGVVIYDTTKPNEMPQVHSAASRQAFVDGMVDDPDLRAAFGLA